MEEKASKGLTTAVLAGGKIVGDVVRRPLASVRKNPWNPNEMTPEVKASLRHGLEHDGWLSSQALLVWATDEDDAARMVIIDGEHRWAVARDLGFTHGPMVFLEGVSEAKARSLTAALNHRRGKSDDAKLSDLLRSIQFDIPDLDLNVGIGGEELMKLLAEPAVLMMPPAAAVAGEIPEGPANLSPSYAPPGATAPVANVRMVQLFLDAAQHDWFQGAVASLAKTHGTKTVTDTVLAVLRDASPTS